MPPAASPVRPSPLILFACAACAAALGAQPPGPAAARDSAPTLRAVFVPRGPRLDGGRLDDPAWRRAPAATGFTQRAPQPGRPSAFRTEVRVLYDRAALYVGVRAFDPEPARVGRQLARRDPEGIYSDWVHVGIDSFRDRRTGFRFSLNPRGVQGDGYLFNDTEEDALWDAVWTGAARVDSAGWTAVLRVPLSQLRYSLGGLAAPSAGLPAGAWGFNVVREVARAGEESWWAPTPPDRPGVVSRFGALAGLDSLGTAAALELVPYARAQATRAPVAAGDPFARPLAGAAAAGLDLRWRLPRNLTLSATANPDFGQVEADPAVVNLTQFEVFFPERRPFFLEGADAFAFGRTVALNDDEPPVFFYTRRIGRAPARELGGAGVRFVDAPARTRILAAAKVSGKTPGGWTVGALAAATAAERARVLDTAGAASRPLVEPAGGYGLLRLRRDFRGGNTVVGAVGSLAGRATGGAFAALLPRTSAVAGVDFEHAWGGRTWTLSGVAAASRVAGAPAFVADLQRAPYRLLQRPDAAHLGLDTARAALAGHYLGAAVAKTGGRHWVGSAAYEEVAPGFELNDLGFQQRADKRALSTALIYREQEQGARGLARRFRSYEAGLYATRAETFGRDLLAQRTALYAEAQLASFWEASLFVSHRAPVDDDRLTRGGPAARRPTRLVTEAELSTDSRRPVVLGAETATEDDRAGRRGRRVALSADLRPGGAVRLRLEPAYERRREVDQFVAAWDDPAAAATGGRRYAFGSIRRSEVNLTTRLDWTFTPYLSLQLFAQPFAAAGRYVAFRSLARPGAFAFDPLAAERGGGALALRAPAAGAARHELREPDYALRSLRGNAVLRWEYRPGSALFVVWQQAGSVDRDPSLGPLGDAGLRGVALGREAGRAFADRGTDVLLVKLSYWLAR